MPLQKHLFFCLNQRDDDKKCCGNSGSEALWSYAKQRLIALNLHHRKGIRANKSGCLGRCSDGPSIVVYPDGVWYRAENTADIDEIIESHLLNGTPVKRLLMSE